METQTNTTVDVSNVTTTMAPEVSSVNATTITTLTPVTQTTEQGDTKDDNDYLFLKLGIVGAIVLVLILIVSCCVCRRRKREKKVPPELPHPYAQSDKRNSAEPAVLFNASEARESSTSSNVHVVGFKPLPGAALLPTRKKSSTPSSSFSVSDKKQTSLSPVLQRSHIGYGNGDIVWASAASKSPTAKTSESAASDQSRDSLYVRPSSLHSPDLNSVGDEGGASQLEENDEDGDVGRSRLDSQKYLLPAELILQLPNDVRKMSGGSLSGDVSCKSPPGNGLQIRWKAYKPIIHAADESSRDSSVYVCMDSGNLPSSPPKFTDSKAGRKDSTLSTTSQRPLPTPCKMSCDKPGYINLRQTSGTSRLSMEPPSPLAGLYEPVSALVAPMLYENASEILRSQLSSPEADDNRRNEPDTYTLCFSPELEGTKTSGTEKKNGSAEQVAEEDHDATAEIRNNSLVSTPDTGHLNLPSERNSSTLSYVNVAEFDKRPSEIEQNSLPPIQANNHVTENLVNKESPKDKGKPSLKAKPELGKTSGRDKPPTAKKPKVVKTKPSKEKINDSNSLEGTLTGLKNAVRVSLIQKARNRLGANNSSSSSSPELSSDDTATLPTANPTLVNNKVAPTQSRVRQSSSEKTPPLPLHEPQTRDFESSGPEHTEYQNLLPSPVQQPDKTGLANETNSSESTKNNKVKEESQSKKHKEHHRKSGSLLRGKLDLSEIRSKLKKTH